MYLVIRDKNLVTRTGGRAQIYRPPPPTTETVTQVFSVKIFPDIFRYCSWDDNMGRNGKGIVLFSLFKEV